MGAFIDNLLKQRFQGRYFIEQYNDFDYRIIHCPLLTDKKILHKFSKYWKSDFDVISSSEVSISRTKRNIRRICLSNNFEYFATWTIDSKLCDRFHLENCIDEMRKHLKAFHRKYNSFKYIYIIETHKNGAFHFHGLVKGIPVDELKKYSKGEKYNIPKYIYDSVEKGAEIFHCSFFDSRLGFNTFSKIKSYTKCCNYIIKYISKDFVKTKENQIYFCSRGLSKGLHYEVSHIPSELFKNAHEFKIDDIPVALVYDFNIKSLSQKNNLIFQKIKD